MNVPASLLHLCKTLRSAGFDAWLVGGCVRDSLMGREPSDWDVATNARPEQTQALFTDSVPIGGHCGTVAVKLDGASYEVTPYRSDGTYTDGRHPDSVRFVDTLEEDLARRDFTMNAIAYDPIDDWWCDPHDGRGAIRWCRIVAVGRPAERFAEDGLRLLRAVRFSATLKMRVGSETLSALRTCAWRLGSIAAERVHDEWHKIMGAERPMIAFALMADYGLLEQVAPEFLPLIGCTQNRYHAFDVWGHTMRVLDATPRDDISLRFAGLFHDIAKPQTKGTHPETGDSTFYNHEEVGAEVTDGILRRLKFSNEERERIVHHVRWHLIPYEPGWTAASVRRWVRRVGVANVKSLCALGRADVAGKGTETMGDRGSVLDELEARVERMQIEQPIATKTTALAIGGADVMAALGIGPGPQVGRELRRLLELVTETPEMNTREGLIAALNAENPHSG